MLPSFAKTESHILGSRLENPQLWTAILIQIHSVEFFHINATTVGFEDQFVHHKSEWEDSEKIQQATHASCSAFHRHSPGSRGI
jgi:hypothetical protein